MNTPLFPGPGLPSEECLEEKLNRAGRKFCHQRQMLEQVVAERPLAALAAGIGVGCIAGRLPLTRVAASAIRLSLASLPSALLIIGAARCWQLLRPLAGASLDKAELAGWDPAEECVGVSRRLQAGEISAAGLCLVALDHVRGDQPRADLQHVLAVHRDNASRLREQILVLGGEPERDAGLPPEWSAGGSGPTWSELRESEQFNVQEMEEALRNPRIIEDIKRLIIHHLIPRTKENLAALQRAESHHAAEGVKGGCE